MPLRDFLDQLNIVQASSLKVEPSNRPDRVKITLNGIAYDNVIPKRPFPLSIPEFIIFVQVQTPEKGGEESQNKEICMLKDYKKLDKQSQRVLEEVLQRIYFIPQVLKVKRLETSGDEFEWEVLTDRGPRILRTRSRRQVINIGKRIVVIDTHDNIYFIEDIEKLDRRTRMLLETVA